MLHECKNTEPAHINLSVKRRLHEDVIGIFGGVAIGIARSGLRVPNQLSSATHRSGNVVLHLAADTVGLVQKEFPVAERRFGILIDRDNDRLDVGVTPAFAGS
jgi:hypothetical protein